MLDLSQIYRDLPDPPRDRTGWPWHPSRLEPPSWVSGDAPLPSLTIVTPNLNYGETLEASIRSVLLQGYPRLRYIVADGGSVDCSLAIIEKYKPWISEVLIGPDGGQANAINEVLTRESSSFANWLNSDDILRPGALFLLAKAAVCTGASIVTAGRVLCNRHGEENSVQIAWKEGSWIRYVLGAPDFHQDATLFSLELFRKCGGLRTDMLYMFDTEFYYRALRVCSHVACVDSIVSVMRVTPEIKTLRSDPRKLRERRILDELHRQDPLRLMFDLLVRLRLEKLFVRLLQVRIKSKVISLFQYNPILEEWVITRMLA